MIQRGKIENRNNYHIFPNNVFKQTHCCFVSFDVQNKFLYD